jgi:8-oxo-dGTP pyrophosphatase MutT (NUDIX family)
MKRKALSMKHWQVLGQKILYTSPWISLRQDRVQLPDGKIIDHHVVDYPHKSVCILPVKDDKQVLMIKNYRFITDSEAWELPAGMVDSGETFEQAATRELLEETGYFANQLIHLGYSYPSNGSSNQEFHAFVATDLVQQTETFDTNEIVELQWFSPEHIKTMVLNNEIVDSFCLTTLFLAQLRGFARL